MDRTIGKYRIIRELGRGGMGIVFLAEDETLGREVAIKIVRPGLHIEARGLDRFKREARAAAALSHPNIAHINALEEIDGQLIIEMPYLPGGSLREKMRAGMSIGSLARTLDQVLQALEMCHNAGIIHRDVKPSNILYDDLGTAKLSDFGAATLAAEELGSSVMSDSTTFIGTPRYACPESWEEASPAPAWDLFSLGVLTWEALAGELPNSNLSPLAFLRNLHARPLPPLREAAPEVSPELADLINSLCAHDAQDRPVSAAEARRLLLEAPEAKGFNDAVDTTARIRKPRRHLTSIALRRQLTRTLKRTRRYSLPVILSATSGVLLTAWWYAQSPPATGAAMSGPSAHPVFQSNLAEDRLPNAAELLRAWRTPNSEAVSVFDVLSGEKITNPDRIMLRRRTEGYIGMGIVDEDVLLLRLRSSSENTFDIEGIWGSYRNGSRRALVLGPLTGIAHSTGTQRDSMRLALNFFSDVTIDSWTKTLFVVSTSEDVTDSAVAYSWEEEPAAMPVLTRELLTRFPQYSEVARAFVPSVADGWLLAAVSREPIEPDGRLDEPVWQSADARIPVPIHASPRLRIASTPEGLAVGITRKKNGFDAAKIRIDILPGYDVPRENSGRLSVVVASDNVSATWRFGDETHAVDSSIQAVKSQSDAESQLEVLIGWEALDRQTPPVPGEIFRCNARVASADGSIVEARWGWPETNAVEHGLVVEFSSSLERNVP